MQRSMFCLDDLMIIQALGHHLLPGNIIHSPVKQCCQVTVQWMLTWEELHVLPGAVQPAQGLATAFQLTNHSQ
jgi:hypothetical protein